MKTRYERWYERPLTLRAFARRLAKHCAAAGVLWCGSLAVGMAGFLHFEGLSGCDAFLNAAMLLSGMGPVYSPLSFGGKLFAGLYALYAALVFVGVAGILAAPVAHRFLHKYYWEDKP